MCATQGLTEYLEDMTEKHFDDDRFLGHVMLHYEGAEKMRREYDGTLAAEAAVRRDLARSQRAAAYPQMLMGVVDSLPALNPLYRFSLRDGCARVAAAAQRLRSARESTELDTSREDFQDLTRRLVYSWVSAGLTSPHAFVFAFGIGIGHLCHEGMASPEEVRALAGILADQAAHPGDPLAFGSSSGQVRRLEQFLPQSLPVLPALCESFARDAPAWREYFAAGCSLVDDTPMVMPGGGGGSGDGAVAAAAAAGAAQQPDLSVIQKLLVWALFAPAALQERCRELVIGTIGDQFVTRPPPRVLDALQPSERLDQYPAVSEDGLLLPTAVEGSSAPPSRAKLLTLATVGVDVVQAVLATGVEWCREGRVLTFGPDAAPATVAAAVSEAVECGNWVILQDVHLASRDFALQVGDIVRRLRRADAPAAHDRFALIVTADVDDAGRCLPPVVPLLCDLYVVEQPPQQTAASGEGSGGGGTSLLQDCEGPGHDGGAASVLFCRDAASIIGQLCDRLESVGAC